MARIYVSSTFADLRPFRAAVYDRLRQMGHDVVAMEDMTASESRPLAQCRWDIESCELFIGILAWRGGFIPAEGNGTPITQLEYEHAEKRMKRLMFLLSPSVSWLPEFIDSEETAPAIYAFRKRIEEAHVVTYFENHDQLAGSVAVAVRAWEIETGYRPRPKPLVLPEEVRSIEFVPYDRVKLRFRLHPLATVIHTMFMTVWMGGISVILALAVFSDRVEPSDGGSLIVLFLLWLAGLYLFARRRTITFDFKNGWVKISTPGSKGRERPVVHGFELITEKTRAGWRSLLRYGICVIARTEPMPDAESARERLYPFALSLNQQLGMTILDERRVGG